MVVTAVVMAGMGEATEEATEEEEATKLAGCLGKTNCAMTGWK